MTNSAASNDMANAIRSLAMDAVEKANSGHPGLPMGVADIATVLFTKVMKFDPAALAARAPRSPVGLGREVGSARRRGWRSSSTTGSAP